MVTDLYNDAILFVPQGDLIGQKYGGYIEEHGFRKVLLSPAAYSLWITDKSAFYRSLEVCKNGKIVSIFDVGGDL